MNDSNPRTAQRYTSPAARDRMARDLCPECGNPADQHSSRIEFWLPRPFDCSLLPRGVTERTAQYRADETQQHTIDVRNDGWTCTCGTGIAGLNAALFNADRLLRNASAEAHAHEYRGVIDFGAVKV